MRVLKCWITPKVQPACHLYEFNDLYPQQLSKVRLWAAHKDSQWGLQVGTCLGSDGGCTCPPGFLVLSHSVNPQFRDVGRTCITVKYLGITINPGFVWCFSQKHFHMHLISYVLWRERYPGVFRSRRDNCLIDLQEGQRTAAGKDSISCLQVTCTIPTWLIVFSPYSSGSLGVVDILAFAEDEVETGSGHFVF